MIKMLRRGFPNLRNSTFTTSFSSSFSSSLRRLVSSSSSPTPLRSLTKKVVPITASGFAYSDDEENLDSPAVKPTTIPRLLEPRLMVYDGLCHLCHRGVKWVIKVDKDKNIKFCCVQSKAAWPYLKACGLERQDVLHRFLFVEGLDSYSQGSTAALRVLSYLPPPYSALSTLLVVPTPIRDVVYDFIAKRRYKWLGKAEAHLVLEREELLERFIDWDELIDHS